MVKITLSLSEDTEKKLREMSMKPPYNGMKGALSMIVETALMEHFEKQ